MAYYRRGHYRRSPNGGYHYVQPHSVNRYGRGPSAPAPVKVRWIHPMPLHPNATCPVCGARVFFWKNSHGSKVWFDALGPPWPKHPCLDLEQATSSWHRAAIEHARLNTGGVLPAPRRTNATPGAAGIGCATFLVLFCPGSIVLGLVSEATGEDSLATNIVGALLVIATLLATVIAFAWQFAKRFDPHAEADEALKLARAQAR